MDVSWLHILNNTDHYKIKIIRMLHLRNYIPRTLLKLSFWILGKSCCFLTKQVPASQRNDITIPKSEQPFLGLLTSSPRVTGSLLSCQDQTPRAERRLFSKVSCGSKGSGGKSETCRTLMILKSLIILAFKI